METLLQEKLQKRGYIRHGRIKVEPIRRESDWVLPESDSAFMNAGAKHEYVVPNSLRTGQLIDPLRDLTTEEKAQVAKELGLPSADYLNVNRPTKDNYWINRVVILDRNGKYLDLSVISDFIAYKILQANTDYIAPSYEERYNKGTYKFVMVMEEEQEKLNNRKFDIKKEAYMQFGRIEGSLEKMTDFLWLHYLTSKEAKRPPNNASIDYCKNEIGRLIDDKPGVFLSIITDKDFNTKVLIQKAINNGLITREGMMFTVFGEPSSKSDLQGLIEYLADERNNNIRLSIIGKLQALENVPPPEAIRQEPEKEEKKEPSTTINKDLEERLKKLEEFSRDMIEKNSKLQAENEQLKSKVDIKKPVGRPSTKANKADKDNDATSDNKKNE